jgi:hypothetical protein
MVNENSRYEQLAQELRHYDTRLYVTPPALLTILGVSLREIVSWSGSLHKALVLLFLAVVCHSFTVLFAKLSIHQMRVRQELAKLATGHAQKPDRETYRRYSPLWLYYSLSADGNLMVLMMLALVGTWAFAINTALDAAGFSSATALWLTVVGVFVTVPIYYYLILRPASADARASNPPCSRPAPPAADRQDVGMKKESKR